MTLELNTLHEGDCIEMMKEIPDKSVDMILCDLPYGTTSRNKWDIVIPFEPLWNEYERVIKDKGAIVLTAAQPFTTALISSKLSLFKYCLVWNKEISGSFTLANVRPMMIHEDICVFGKGKITYNPIMEDAELKNIRNANTGSSGSSNMNSLVNGAKSDINYNPKKRYPRSILTYSKYSAECNQLKRLHPTQKPLALFEYLIKTYSSEGDTVLDNCIGSGTTAVAAINTKRNFIGIERELEYVEIARKRIAEAKGAE